MEEDLYGEPFAPGAVVASYLIDELASTGGFASVYRARDLGTNQAVALKVLSHELAQSMRMLQRFQREAEAVNRIAHPNIVRIIELGELSDGRPYIAMEWLEGRTLRQELSARGSFTPREAVAILEELGSAVTAAHALGIIHRDIKASNIIAVPAGQWFTVKLVDFGIAKLTAPEDAGTSLTTKTVMGTPEAMSPEQILVGAIDARTDIYALGVLLFQLVTGRPPFQATSILEMQELHLYAAPPLASQLAPVPPAVDAVIARALAKRQADRFASVGELLASLRAALDGDLPASQPASATAARPSGRGIGLYIELGDLESRNPETLADDATAVSYHRAELADDLFDHAAELCERAGLGIILSAGAMLLAAAPLPAPDHASADARKRILAAAQALWASACTELDPQDPGSPQVRIVVHIAGAELTDDRNAVTGGDIVRLQAWPAAPPDRGVYCTAMVLDGLDGLDAVDTLDIRAPAAGASQAALVRLTT